MSISGNKGEWSEFYAFIKILSDKVLHSADKDLELIPNAFIKVLSVLREEDNKNIAYEIDEKENKIVVKSNSEIIGNVPIVHITGKLKTILSKMLSGSDTKEGAFEISEATSLMTDLHCSQIKSDSSKKEDIRLRIEDPITGTQPEKGFSIKSKIGGLSTLLNASQSTNIRFKVVKTKELIDSSKYLIQLSSVINSDECLEFDSVVNDNFKDNLVMIDSQMPKIIGEIVKSYYLGYGSSLSDLTDLVEKLNPLGYSKNHKFYIYKVKQLLKAIAFGMQPSKVWSGSFAMHGGYIIVKKDGELACFHLYDMDNFGEFLFSNTKLETPSTSRHNFGNIYEIDGIKYIDLNLQIRFRN